MAYLPFCAAASLLAVVVSRHHADEDAVPGRDAHLDEQLGGVGVIDPPQDSVRAGLHAAAELDVAVDKGEPEAAILTAAEQPIAAAVRCDGGRLAVPWKVLAQARGVVVVGEEQLVDGCRVPAAARPVDEPSQI